ncbi:uncharacterized protein LOC115623061 [Scaptodrosophila lebanonensis]|uniref:Uncharacterized protein LOC115623061 n=1 Tax=Drosophila lebanonensis TaxID=7225 RepID=A0A6J2TCI5_DROLE|nr:uncharacterized protein LOC115623061 [Scaptodrosophila lebanonensis]
MLQPISERWSRALPNRKSTDCSNIFATGIVPPRESFFPSFERSSRDPPMGLLLGWEFGRQWLHERETYLRDKRLQAKEHHIEPDFTWWLNKRKVTKRRKMFHRKSQGASLANCKLTAFALARKNRRLRAEERNKRALAPNTAHVSGERRNSKCMCKNGKRKPPGK